MNTMVENKLQEVSHLIRQSFPRWSKERVEYASSAITKIKTGNGEDLSVEEKHSIRYPTEFNYMNKFEFEEKENPDNRTIVEKLMTGTAIYPTTSLNFNVYSKEELIKAAPTLKGVPVQRDHSFRAEDTVGKVRKVMLNEKTGRTDYLAGLDPSDDVTKKAEAGYIEFVSIYGEAGKSECTICGEEMSFFHQHWPGQKYEGKIAKVRRKDLTYKHLGMTNYPGVKRAKISGVESDVDDAGGVLTSPTENILFIQQYVNETIFPEYSETNYLTEQESFTEINNGVNNMANENELSEMKELLKKTIGEVDGLKSELKVTSEAKAKLETNFRDEKIAQIVEMELEIGKLTSEKKEFRQTELKSFSPDGLEARHSVTKEWFDQYMKSKPAPKTGQGKSKNFTNERQEMSDEYIFELEAELLNDMLFGEAVSISAVKAAKAYNKKIMRWNNPYEMLILSARQ